MPRSRPSATSLMVKSNSLRATKSIARDALRLVLGLDRDLGADEADLEIRIERLHRLGRLHVAQEGWRGGVQHEQLILPRIGRDIGEAQPVRRRVDQLRVGNERGRLGEPGRIPERADLAFRI